jgi:hypothetical protein
MRATAAAILAAALLLATAGGAVAAQPAPASKGAAPAISAPPAPAAAPGGFNAAAYKSTTQADILKNPKDFIGKKVTVSDPFQFCGSDFCVQIRSVKINTREYWCFTTGSLCVIRMYLKKDHPQAEEITEARKGDMVTVYGTFEEAGALDYVIVDRIVVEKKKK